VFIFQSYICVCPAGFLDQSPSPINKPGRLCVAQQNECEDGTNRCSPNAICTDTESGYVCRCKTGYIDYRFGILFLPEHIMFYILSVVSHDDFDAQPMHRSNGLFSPLLPLFAHLFSTNCHLAGKAAAFNIKKVQNAMLTLCVKIIVVGHRQYRSYIETSKGCFYLMFCYDTSFFILDDLKLSTSI